MSRYVYVAGPYTGDEEGNVARALVAALEVAAWVTIGVVELLQPFPGPPADRDHVVRVPAPDVRPGR